MDEEVAMSEENQQVAEMETTSPAAAAIIVGTSQDEIPHVVSSPSHNEDSSGDVLTDSDKNKAETSDGDSVVGDTTTLSPDKHSDNTSPGYDGQQAIPSDEMESSEPESSTVGPSGHGEDKKDDTITERDEIKSSADKSGEEDSKQLTEASPASNKVAESLSERDINILTVTLNVEVDVVDNTIAPKTEAENQTDESQNILPDGTIEKQILEDNNKIPPSNDNIAAPSAEPTIAEDKQEGSEGSKAPTGRDVENTPTDSTESMDWRCSTVSSAKQTTDTTPSKPGTAETGISFITKGDPSPQSRRTMPHPPSQQLVERPQTHATGSTDFNYDEMKDFTSPDYEYARTPLYSTRANSGVRQERKTVSRDESVKSVTFADDLTGRMSTKDFGVEEEDEDSTSEDESDKETQPDAGKEEVGSKVKGEEVSQQFVTPFYPLRICFIFKPPFSFTV